MKIRTKLTLGVGLLFILITLLTFVGARYINALKNDTENILKANYNTLEYSRNILIALDETFHQKEAFAKIEHNLRKQRKNVTEIGEKESTEKLDEHIKRLKASPSDTAVHFMIREDISEIMRLNMEAIQRKSNIAKETAESATIWVTFTGTICFLIAFTLLINLPNSIANPIKELTESIRQIANKKYNQRVHFESHDEFGELAKSFNTMAKKLEEYNNSSLSKLLFEKKRIETLIDNMHDAVIGLDENKKILFVNDEALRLLNMQGENLIGYPAAEVSVSNDLMRSLIQDMGNVDAETQPIKIYADQKESYFEKELVKINITPTGESEEQLIGHVLILKNITPFKELDFAKTNFIAIVSHELKTPISSMKMSLQLLENKQVGTLNEEQTQLVESLKDDSNRLLKITGELLNMSQVETGNIQLNIQQSRPEHILEFAINAVKNQADQKQIELSVDQSANLPDLKADVEKTAWVLTNFLTNAIRYSPEQSKVKLEIRQEDEFLVFSVNDQGKGIEPRYKDKVFDRYFQIPGSNKTGTGLGLAISKDFILAQGGKIGVESEIGMGSTFFFKLPLA
ncbi:HAMP domain-containing protein [Emticicia sp. CRIBPO]|uniref:sensor histidine kinase n=1 Tax=Emticicia sp. CRIBPO TaxID=2683258 RepID=UPI0014135588|nr:ATP-binding protein [Emticicia sp. CRIBPO]NBA88976.1 HAMP domain-containing protein [Emticicia sp. CRIBPO]